MPEMICETCGGTYTVAPYRTKRTRFCSSRCRSVAVSKLHQRPLTERFWEKVDRRSEAECWPWIGATTFGGYGVIGIGRERLVRAHRVSYEIHKGPIASGLVIRHTCDNPSCVNPAHLLTGSTKDNVQDAVNRNRHKGPPEKLTEKQVKEIRKSTGTVRAIAAQYGVSITHVSFIRNNLRRRKSP